MNTNSGWIKIAPSTPGSRFSKYDNQLVVIITHGRGGKKSTYKMYIPQAVFDALGKPKFLDILERGSNVGLCVAETEGRGNSFTVSQNFDDKNKPNGMRYLNCHAYIHKKGLNEGVYTAYQQNGMVIFDTFQKPSVL